MKIPLTVTAPRISVSNAIFPIEHASAAEISNPLSD